jgi:hypothetical protein
LALNVPNVPSSGRLLSLDIVEGRDAVPGAKKLLKSQSASGGISTWDASSIFFEMHSLEVEDKPSPRTLVLLYAADLFFRLRWEIIPALEEGKCVVAVPYVETGFAFGALTGLPKSWLNEVFRFAPKPSESFHLNGTASAKLGTATNGFIEFCSSILNQDLRPKFSAYFDDLERRGACRSI